MALITGVSDTFNYIQLLRNNVMVSVLDYVVVCWVLH